MKKIIIFGDTSFAGIVAEYIHADTADKVIAYTIDAGFIDGRSTFEGLPLIPFEELIQFYSPKTHHLLVALSAAAGKKHLNSNKIKQVKSLGYPLYSFIHSTAFIAPSAKIGENVLIFPHAIIEPRVKIQDGVFVRSGAYVSHETEIGAYSYLAPKATFSGKVVTGDHCFFGTNSTIRDRVTIGHDVIVGAGAVVLHNLKNEAVIKAAESKLLDVERSSIKL